MSKLDGDAETRALHLIDISSLDTYLASFSTPITAQIVEEETVVKSAAITCATANQTSSVLCQEVLPSLSSRVSHIIGIADNNKLFFMDEHSWVCSIELQRLKWSGLRYARHLFIPYDWFAGSRGIICALSQRKVLFVRNDNLAIVKGGLDYAETVLVQNEETRGEAHRL